MRLVLRSTSTSHDSTTVTATVAPTRRTAWSCTSNPRAAMATMVNQRLTSRKDSASMGGKTPTLRAAANAMNPTINQGMSRPKVRWRVLSIVRWMRLKTTIIGPNSTTRTHLTSVPIWLLMALTGTVAASTCGTA
jgi:hypothetical protein